MDAVLIIAGILAAVIGIIGCLLPVIPGPPISYLALLALQFTDKTPFTGRFLVIYALLTIAVTILDYYVPIYGTRRLGGSKYGIWGSAIGLVIGLIFLGPFGLILGPFAGAVLGEVISGKHVTHALRSGFGSFAGFIAGTIMKLVLSSVMAYHFFNALLA